MHASTFDLARIVGQLNGESWLIEPAAHAGMIAAIERVNADNLGGVLGALTAKPTNRNEMVVSDGIAELQITGPIMRSPGILERLFLNASDSSALADQVIAATRRGDVRGILLRIDSPGGSVNGTPELADAVRAAAKVKPVVAFTDGMAASAAYWIASQASTVLASTSASVGSIGVYIPWADSSKRAEMLGIKTGVVKNTGADFKGMGFPGTSYTPEQMAHLQARADDMAAMFKSAVTSTRKRVSADSMRGQTFLGAAAVSVGLIDGVSSYLGAWEKISALAGIGNAQASVLSPLAAYEDLKRRMIAAATPLERGQLLNEMRGHAAKHSL